jgi:hemoglobin-like flavoprotein
MRRPRSLLETLREILGDAMTAEVETTWSETYDAMAASMVRGMQAQIAKTSGGPS